jgi:hypothetical protein
MFVLVLVQFLVDYGERLVYKETWLKIKRSVYCNKEDEEFKK